MKKKWNKTDTLSRNGGNNSPPQKFEIIAEPVYKPRLILKTPSLRAITNYNNLSLNENNYDNLSFIPESENGDLAKYDEPYTTSNPSIHSGITNPYDYPSMRSLTRTPTSAGSDLGSEMGSTIKLVRPRMDMSCQTWFVQAKTIICTISLAAGLGNLYRLPQTALAHGGLPFLIAYIILTLLVGLPLLFLELGIGQLAEEGFIKSWRAVPFFKGVGYMKLLAGCLLCIYYPLYMSLSLFYIIWIAKGPIPFQECSVVKMKETGYSAESIDRQQCLRNTFLESPFENAFWYGVFVALLFAIWLIIMLLSIKRTKSFTRSLLLLALPTIICYFGLIVIAILSENHAEGLAKLTSDVRWNDLYSANIWYYAAIQVFFSTNVGFGTFITNAGIMYSKINPLWIATSYILANLLFGVGSVLLCYCLSGSLEVQPKEDYIKELNLMTLIYDITMNSKKPDAKTWAIVVYVLLILVGLISMVTLIYTLLKAITVESKKKLKWWQTSVIVSLIGFLIGAAFLLKKDFLLVHLLDEYIVGNLIIISVIMEVFALITFYGTERIRSDFEFMLGHILWKIWLVLWWILPVLLTGIFAWGLATLPYTNDSEWLSGVGYGIVLIATIFVFVMGLYTITKQDAYSFTDKMKTAFKPSNNWGPKDPMLRYAWVQWCTKIKQGERDFTLKRRGTRDYTRSIKKSSKKQIAQAASDLTRSSVPPSNVGSLIQHRTHSNGNVNVKDTFYENGITLIKIGESDSQIECPNVDYMNTLNQRSSNRASQKQNNPLGRTSIEIIDGTHSEDYGTFRKGPYVIDDHALGHVCHRKYNQSEIATDL